LRVFIIKPDAIGDFILASGCIRLIAREAGEENLVLAVRSDVAPLAKSQFPKALILPLTLREKRRILNVTTINILHSLPSWLRMLSLRVDAALCLRSMRAYLHTIWFYTPRAQRRIACENLLLAQPRFRRPAVENVVTRFFKPALLPYPSPGKLPTDIEANRSVAVEFLGRKISDAEILPSLNPPSPIPRSDRWLLCPFSSSITKDYPAEKWAAAIQILTPERGNSPLHLAAGPTQQEQLAAFAQILRNAGIQNLVVDPATPLADFLKSIAAARIVLTVDTAAAHMACAVGSPAVIASAGHHPGVYAPYSPNGLQHWIMPPPLLRKGEWRKNLTPDNLASAICEILTRSCA
jgi:ADP-heptose:LPS heptosyltransferase